MESPACPTCGFDRKDMQARFKSIRAELKQLNIELGNASQLSVDQDPVRELSSIDR